MAQTLVLGTPVKFTLDATAGNVTHVTCPLGTRSLVISSAEAVFYEVSATADGGSGTPAAQLRFDAGTFSYRFPDMGTTEQGALQTATVYRFAGTSSAQEVWMMAAAEV